jgi:hypothetical protein
VLLAYLNHPEASKLPAVLKICGKYVFCNPANDLNNPYSDTTPEWGIAMTDAETVYICKASSNLNHLFSQESGGSITDHLKNHFPFLSGIMNGSSTNREYGDNSRLENAVLGITKDIMQVLVYDFYDQLDFGQCSIPMGRGNQRGFVKNYLERKIELYFDNGGSFRYRVVRPKGPLIIVVDSNKLSRKKQPTARQYVRMVRMNYPEKFRAWIVREEQNSEIEPVVDESWKDSSGESPGDEFALQ